MKELVILSGKGGTGKTSLSASFALLADVPVMADCDVDASNLPLVLSPDVRETHAFQSGVEAEIDPALCEGCGACARLCRFEAVQEGERVFSIDPTACEGCGVCARFCPYEAISLFERTCGSWFVSKTRAGMMVHARLAGAAENSGKLVSLVRREAKRIAGEQGAELVLVDGPPGIGCPVIAALSGADAALIVSEPTPSGHHDLLRALELTRHFKVPAFVCVNKWDLSADGASKIETAAALNGGVVLGRVRYDPGVSAAQKRALAVIETDAPSGPDIMALWSSLSTHLEKDPLS